MTLVETPDHGTDASPEELQLRLHQQCVLADFGRFALQCHDLDELLREATARTAHGLRVSLAKVLEFVPERGTLFLRAGVGWMPGVVGFDEIGADLDSPAGYCFRTGESVISNQLGQEKRFRTPDVMAAHGVRRAINVPIDIDGVRFGVLEADSHHEGRFQEADLAFMRGFANLIGVAIGRQRAEEALERANRHQQLLTREASHRVKNSLAMVSALLGLRMRGIADEGLQQVLADTQARIHTIARAHDLLWRGDRVGTVPLDSLICELAEELVAQAPGHRLSCAIAPIELDADTAIPLGLMVTELVTNALKYAYDDPGGEIAVEIEEGDAQLSLTVRDRGRGLPPGVAFDGKGTGSLGTRIIASTVRQLRGHLEVTDAAPGTAIRFTMPMPGPRQR